MRRLFILIALLALAACAKAPPQAPVADAGAARIWAEMEAASERAAGPYRLQLSMRFGEEGNTRRVTGVLWGNGSDQFRLDVMAGVGAMVAMIAEAGDDFVVYLPRDGRAYFHQGVNRPLLKIGVPVPFDLAQLGALLRGNFALVFGKAPESEKMLASGNASFALGGNFAGELELNPAGAPLKWTQASGAWQLELGYDEDAPALPKSMKLQNRDGKRAIILVKEREADVAQFGPEQLKLTMPAGVPLLPLSEYKNS